MNPEEIERDMPECETPRHNVHEETTYEIAEREKWEDYYREAKLGAI